MDLNFRLPNVDGRDLSPDDFPEAKGFVIVFTCNHCPYAIAYEKRLVELNNELAPKGFPLIAINSNDASRYPQDSFENMQVRATQKGFNFPYLYDESQQVAHAYGAERTPDAFVVSREKGELKIRYRGALDDNYENANKVQHRYLVDAVEQILQGKPVSPDQTRSVGCSVKWKM